MSNAQNEDKRSDATELRAPPAMVRPLFVAAVRQHVGKTTVSLALMSGLRKRFGKVGRPHGAPAHLHCSLTEHLHCTSIATTPAHICKVGFMKPVGQQHVNVEHNGAMVRVDKDVQLIKECVEMPRHTQPHTHLVLRGGRAERSAHTLAPART